MLAWSRAPHYGVALVIVEETPAVMGKLMCMSGLVLAGVSRAQRRGYRQLQMNGSAAQGAMSDFKRNMAAIQQDYQRRTAASQSQFDEMDRALRGVDLTVDPLDGKQRKVVSTCQTHGVRYLKIA